MEDLPADWLWESELSRLEVLGNRGNASAPGTRGGGTGYTSGHRTEHRAYVRSQNRNTNSSLEADRTFV